MLALVCHSALGHSLAVASHTVGRHGHSRSLVVVSVTQRLDTVFGAAFFHSCLFSHSFLTQSDTDTAALWWLALALWSSTWSLVWLSHAAFRLDAVGLLGDARANADLIVAHVQRVWWEGCV